MLRTLRCSAANTSTDPKSNTEVDITLSIEGIQSDNNYANFVFVMVVPNSYDSYSSQ
jgi:hypothetical protein